jgi:hypothetical protein
MNPDRIPITQLRGDHFGEEEIDLVVSIPGILVNAAYFMQLVVE